jgi:epoxyqueuosine reductase
MKQSEMTGGIAFLSDAGLNLLAVLDCAALPEPITALMLTSGVPLSAYRQLVLLGHGGQQLWAALQKWGMKTADPVDHYTRAITRQFLHDYLGNPPDCWLYPQTDYLVPLQQLGALAGWSYPSPLGQGIHPEFGVWFAYRAAFLTTAELPLRLEPERPSPCASCTAKPCITACPVGAVQPDRFAIDGCARYRLRADSPCADRCLARLACPFFPEHRYTLPQIQYHYRHSWDSLRDWYGQVEGTE